MTILRCYKTKKSCCNIIEVGTSYLSSDLDVVRVNLCTAGSNDNLDFFDVGGVTLLSNFCEFQS